MARSALGRLGKGSHDPSFLGAWLGLGCTPTSLSSREMLINQQEAGKAETVWLLVLI